LLYFRECATPPHVQEHHTTWLNFTRPSPALVLQATNAGVRMPSYEATHKLQQPCHLDAIITQYTPTHTNSYKCTTISVHDCIHIHKIAHTFSAQYTLMVLISVATASLSCRGKQYKCIVLIVAQLFSNCWIIYLLRDNCFRNANK